MSTEDYGFVIVRNVQSKTTGMYWQEAYRCIRKVFGTNVPIMIVDDSSCSRCLASSQVLPNEEIVNCTIVEASCEHHGRGEILGYYYFWKLRPFRTACVIHDSVFIKNSHPLLEAIQSTNECKFLWTASLVYNHEREEKELIRHLHNHNHLLSLYDNKDKWRVCFGVMSVITHDFLTTINDRHKFFDTMLPKIINRTSRTYMERAFAIVVLANLSTPISGSTLSTTSGSVYGDLHAYVPWGRNFEDDYIGRNRDRYKHLPAFKVWTGR